VEEPEVARAPHSVTLQPNSNGTIRIDLPGGVSLHIERDTDLELLRAIVEMLRA